MAGAGLARRGPQVGGARCWGILRGLNLHGYKVRAINPSSARFMRQVHIAFEQDGRLCGGTYHRYVKYVIFYCSSQLYQPRKSNRNNPHFQREVI